MLTTICFSIVCHQTLALVQYDIKNMPQYSEIRNRPLRTETGTEGQVIFGHKNGYRDRNDTTAEKTQTGSDVKHERRRSRLRKDRDFVAQYC